MKFRVPISSSGSVKRNFEVDDHCPICQKPTNPDLINSSVHNIEDCVASISLTLRCLGCKHFWVEEYLVDRRVENAETITHLKIKPELPSDIPITDDVALISPLGKAIYTQALKAEQECLDHIAGIGYRKALEFFVKDFVIALNPNDKEKISKLLLKQVIDNYIDDDNLKTFATATTYIGNDETHYTRKHSDKDLLDLKRYLKGFLYHMDMKLSFLDAHELVNRPK